MKLYHFTNHVWLQRILKEGITRGDVATSATGGFNAPCLTSNGDAEQQGWSTGSEAKLSIRLTVEIDERDPLLKTWVDVCREHRVSGKWRKVMNETGGLGAAHWYVYFGVVPPESITETGILKPMTAEEEVFMRADREGRLEQVPTADPGVFRYRIIEE